MSCLIRYKCRECGEFLRGGREDTECPLCGGGLMIVELGVGE